MTPLLLAGIAQTPHNLLRTYILFSKGGACKLKQLAEMAIYWLELRVPVLQHLPLVEARDCDGLQPKTDLYSRTKWLTSLMPTDDITSLTERNDVSSSSRACLNRIIFT